MAGIRIAGYHVKHAIPENDMLEMADSTPAPKISFREATEIVPTFNDYNIPFSQFAQSCRRARDIIPSSSEEALTKLLINKLRSRAYSAVEREECETMTQLIDIPGL